MCCLANENYEIGVKKKEKNIADLHVQYSIILLYYRGQPELGRFKIRFADYALSFHVGT